jgi:hypothetical protein
MEVAGGVVVQVAHDALVQVVGGAVVHVAGRAVVEVQAVALAASRLRRQCLGSGPTTWGFSFFF